MDGWTRQSSPFHEGEQAIQARVGVRDRIELQGKRVIREFLPDQHQQFYGQLPFLVVGTVDHLGRPWASLVVGEPGFISSPDDHTLRVEALPLPGDPLQNTLKVGADIGILGIALGTRRRNRMNGVLTEVDGTGFTIRVTQSFGNCPMYIQRRQVQVLTDRLASGAPVSSQPQTQLDPAMERVIASADTMFVATSYGNGSENSIWGADASHRGGKPGFVRVDDPHTLTFPDFAGNMHFNTIGNLLLNPRIGLIFPDFQTGDLVTLTGTGEIIWEGEELRAFEGAERLFRIRIEEVLYLPGSLPLRAEFEEYSPLLDNTGSWDQAAERIEAQKLTDQYRPFQVTQVITESETIRSFLLQPTDDRPVVSYDAGQELPIRLTLPDRSDPMEGALPLSAAPGQDHYRITVADRGSLSSTLFRTLQVGSTVEALAPRGDFTLDTTRRPVVLLSEGVGIAPVMAMLAQIMKLVDCCGIERVTWLVHQGDGIFGETLGRADRYYDTIHIHTVSEPIGVELLNRILTWDEYEFYLSGSPTFTDRLERELQGLGIADRRLHRLDSEG